MLKQHEALSLPMRDFLDLFRRCEDIASVIDRGRKNGGKYGTAEALIRLTSEFSAEVRLLQSVARQERSA